jgi:hypothetical protein
MPDPSCTSLEWDFDGNVVLGVVGLHVPACVLSPVFEVKAIEIVKGKCLHARMLVKAAEGWIDQPISAAVSLLEEKSSLPA